MILYPLMSRLSVDQITGLLAAIYQCGYTVDMAHGCISTKAPMHILMTKVGYDPHTGAIGWLWYARTI